MTVFLVVCIEFTWTAHPKTFFELLISFSLLSVAVLHACYLAKQLYSQDHSNLGFLQGFKLCTCVWATVVQANQHPMTFCEVLATIGRCGLGVLTAREGAVHLKTTVVAVIEVNVNAAMGSVISELGSISSLKEEQTTSPLWRRCFLSSPDWHWQVYYVTWFVDLIGWS